MSTQATVSTPPRTTHSPDVPRLSPVVLRLFGLYMRWYLYRHFHAVRLSTAEQPGGLEGWPVVVYLNHPSWWDPLLALLLSQQVFPDRSHYGPIEAAAVARYGFFEKMGFFGIETGTARGAAKFLRTSQAILADPTRALWITAQGHFVDARERPVRLQPGLGHLAHRLRRCAVLPLALEYCYWDERFPEALARFGEPVFVTDGTVRSPEEWTALFEQRLAAAQDALASEARQRSAAGFLTLLGGRAGVGGIYDLWRSLRAYTTGERFQREHGAEHP